MGVWGYLALLGAVGEAAIPLPSTQPPLTNPPPHPPQMLPESLNYAIVDEADSILIDESRNPMILSQPLYDTAEYVKIEDKVGWLLVG